MVGGLLDRLNFHCLAPFAASHFSSVPLKSRLSDTLLVIGKGIKEGGAKRGDSACSRARGEIGKAYIFSASPSLHCSENNRWLENGFW